MESDLDLFFRTISLQNHVKEALEKQSYFRQSLVSYDTRGIFYVRREVDLMKTAKVNACIVHIFGKIELLSIHAT